MAASVTFTTETANCALHSGIIRTTGESQRISADFRLRICMGISSQLRKALLFSLSRTICSREKRTERVLKQSWSN